MSMFTKFFYQCKTIYTFVWHKYHIYYTDLVTINLLMEKQWHDIPGYEWLYKFNWHTNQVKRFIGWKEKIIKLHIGKPMITVDLRKEWTHNRRSLWSITLLITQWERPKWLVCCHNDWNQWNNFPENLRYDTPRNNFLDSEKHWTHVNPRKKVRRSDGKIFESTQEAGRYIGKKWWGISRVCRWKGKSAYGYRWEYIS